ncbi:MAG: amino acid adenylation domain-containing protein [Chloroflexota bacterium]
MINTLPQIIKKSVQDAPQQTAFKFDDNQLSYAELWSKMNQLARALQYNGVKRGDRVGIYLHKSLESMISVFGILQAGAAYVPIDPHLPLDRLAFILEDCGIQHLISQPSKSSNISTVADQTKLKCVIGAGNLHNVTTCLSWSDVYRLDNSEVKNRLMEQDIAYIMYTSGSTGTPKGIIHTHQSGLTYAQMAAAEYQLSADDRLSNFPPLHFDQSIFDIFSGTLAGATVVIIPEEYMKFPASLSELIEDEHLTIWYSVPFALIQLLLHGVLEERNLTSLRWVLYGGEPFPPKHMRGLQQAWTNARFSNVYGPAEVNQCTAFAIPPLAKDQNEPIPIGRIWPNADGLIVDEENKVVPTGEAGELLVRAPTMMQGYWNRPDLNTKAFFYDQHDGDVQHKYYRTGDLVQELPDGELLFLGRKDRQVKVRGYRIELDEIEAALADHEAVAEAASYIKLDSSENKTLEAAVTLKSGLQIDQMALRLHLQQKVPKYAIPEKIVILQDFPRTGSGKINRRELQKSLSENLQLTETSHD